MKNHRRFDAIINKNKFNKKRQKIRKINYKIKKKNK